MRPIDADALREDLRRFFPVEVLEGIEPKILFAQIMHDIDNAPTVAYPFEKFQTMLCGTCQAYMRIEPERPQGEWINAEERLPAEMEQVLVWFEYYRHGDYNYMYQTYGFCYVCDGKWSPFINGETGWTDARIIAWQPLPEPYKEGGTE